MTGSQEGPAAPMGAQEISVEPDDTQEVPQAAVRMGDNASALLKGMSFDLFDA